MYYTSIEQSKKLLELGMCPESADMYWFRDDNEIPRVFSKDMMHDSASVTYPCWSVGALIKALNETCDRCEIDLRIDKKWNIFAHAHESYSFYHGYTGYDTVLDACIEVIEWLLGNDFIKKGE